MQTRGDLPRPREQQIVTVRAPHGGRADLRSGRSRALPLLRRVRGPAAPIPGGNYPDTGGKGQDIAGLKALGARARTLYPDKALGYLALGRAAKLVRADEEMLGFYREALLRNPDLAEVHYDMGLVLHARSEDAEEAAAHYQKVLDLVPKHPRRQVIEGWIASLKSPETSGGGQ